MELRPVLGYVEWSLPGETFPARLALAREHDLTLEVAHRGPGVADGVDWDALAAAGVPVVTVQAWGLHDAHPLHSDPERRRAGERHLLETIDIAAAHGVPRVLAVAGFGHDVCDRPFERCLECFGRIAPHARERGVRVLLELLSPRRAGALTDPGELERLIDELAAPDVFGSAIDLGHLADAGQDPDVFLEQWEPPVEELQLRGADSTPPARDLPLARLLGRLRVTPAVVCIEHRQPTGRSELAALIGHLERELDAFAAG